MPNTIDAQTKAREEKIVAAPPATNGAFFTRGSKRPKPEKNFGLDRLKVLLPELHDSKTGRIDARQLANFVGVPLKPLSEGLRLNYKAVHRNPSATAFQTTLRPVKRSLEILHELLGSAQITRVWLNTPHPDLNGSTALEMILDGKAEAVALILENAWNGVPV